MNEQAKKIVAELIICFIVILLLIVLRPLFVGQVTSAGSPYTISYNDEVLDTDNESPTYNTYVKQVTTETITPSATLSATQTNSIYSIIIYLVALITLIVILLTIAGKL